MEHSRKNKYKIVVFHGNHRYLLCTEQFKGAAIETAKEVQKRLDRHRRITNRGPWPSGQVLETIAVFETENEKNGNRTTNRRKLR